MRENALQLGLLTALALAAPCASVAATHTVKPAAHPLRAPAPPAKAGSHAASAVRGAHGPANARVQPSSRPRTTQQGRLKGHAEPDRTPTVELHAGKTQPRLSKAQQRALEAVQAREARHEHRPAKGELALNTHPLRRDLPVRAGQPRPAAPPVQMASRGGHLPLAERPVTAPRGASVGVSTQPMAEAALQAADAQPPVLVHHDRKQHFSAGSGADNETGAPAPPVAGQAPPPVAAGRTLTGVSHPDELDEQAPMPPQVPANRQQANLPAAPPVAQARPVPGPGRPSNAAAPAQRSAIGTPLVMAAAPAASVSAGPDQPLPEPVAQVEPSAAVKAQLPSIEAEVVDTPLVGSLFNRQGQLMMPPALKGSHEILVHQNVEADREGLARVRDDNDLARMRAQRLLVALPDVPGLDVDERLPANRRYARPWTVKFLADLARAHSLRFHTTVILTSAVRTVEVQQRLLRTNGNAAPAEGETASPHLTGQAVDLGKKPMSPTEIAWMRAYLLPLVEAGKIDVEEEFQQACFHISVYRAYQPSGPAEPRRTPASALASAIPIK